MTNINIEFSHIYADEDFSAEHVESIKLLKKIIKSKKLKNSNITTSVLIDDFNAASLILDEEKFLEQVRSFGVPVDFVAYESKFCDVADQIIRLLPQDKLKIEYFNSVKKEVLILENDGKKVGLKEKFYTHQRHTCAMLSSAWILCRLGCFEFSKGSVRGLGGLAFKADELLMILPEKYRKSEEKANEIIGLTKYASVLKNIKYDYYK